MPNDLFTEKISLWLDDELDTAEQMHLREHLLECAHCRQAYQEMKHLDQMLRGAALVMVAPAPGFARRFEARLAEARPPKLWHIGLVLVALLVGSLVFLAVWGATSGLAAVSLVNIRLVSRSMYFVANSVDDLRLCAGLGVLVLKTSLITMEQPLFWGFVAIAGALAALWVRLMRQLSQRGLITANLVL